MRGIRKIYMLFLIFVMTVFFGAAFTFSPPDAHADAIDNSITKLQGVYSNLDASDKANLVTAKNKLATTLSPSYNSAPWVNIFNNFLPTNLVVGGVNQFSSPEEAKTSIISFIRDLEAVQYSSDATELRNNVDTFRTTHSSTVTKLFGNDFSADQIINLFLSAETHAKNVILSEPLEVLVALASGDYSGLQTNLVTWSKEALNLAVQDNPTFQTKLSNIGWSIDSLVEAKDAVSQVVDPGYAGEIALYKAYVRSEAKFLVNGSPIEHATPISLTVGSSKPCALSVLGFNQAGSILSWTSANTGIVKIENGNIVGVSAGTTQITAYSSNADTNWAYKGTVVVTAAPVPAPTFVSAYSNVAGTVLRVEFSKAMASPVGKHAQFTVTTNSVANTVTAAALNHTSSRKINLTLTNPVVYGNTVTVSYTAGTVTAADGGLLATFAAQPVTIPMPVDTPTVAVDNSNKEIAITSDTPDVTVTIPSNVTDATINVSEMLNAPDPVTATVTTDPLPAMTILATTSISATPVKIEMPSGTTITAPSASNWDGTIAAPTVRAVESVTVTPDAGKTATVSTVIEVGFGDVELKFNKAVRLLIPGQAGKQAGYARGGTFTKIDTVMSADTQAAGDALPEGGDGKIDVGSDLVIWTKHFTSFVSYTQTDIGGGGGGGGGAPPSSNKVEKTIQSGTVTTAGITGKITVEIPAGAVTGTNASVVIEPMSDSEAEEAGMPLLSPVMDVKLLNGTLSGKINITLYFNKNKLNKDQEPVAYYNSGSQWTRLEGVVDYNNQTITLNMDHLTLFAVFAATKEAPKPTVNFTDVQDHWAQGAINKLAGMGVINGYPDGTFKPENKITRAEVTAILVKALNLKPGADRFIKLADEANIPAWARESVAAAVAEGIVKGYPQPDGTITFEAGKPVTRAELAAMTANIITRKFGPVAPATLVFSDKDNIPNWAIAAVGTVVSKGIVSGYPDNTFKAENQITRAEAASIILRLLELK